MWRKKVFFFFNHMIQTHYYWNKISNQHPIILKCWIFQIFSQQYPVDAGFVFFSFCFSFFKYSFWTIYNQVFSDILNFFLISYFLFCSLSFLFFIFNWHLQFSESLSLTQCPSDDMIPVTGDPCHMITNVNHFIWMLY